MKPYFDDGQITIYCGDCREILPNLSADVLVTDPPYGIAYASGQVGNSWWHGEEIANDKDTAMRDAVLDWWGDRPALVFGSWKVPHPNRTRTVLVWDQGPALGMGALDLPWKPSWHEIYVIGKGFHGRRDGAVLQCPPVQSMAKNGRLHPNEKPVRLMHMLLQKCPDGTVIDPFMGSGSTIIAARNLGRRAIGIEIDEQHAQTAVRRLQQQVLPMAVTA